MESIRNKKTTRSDLEIVRAAFMDERSIAHMKDWRNWLAALALIALMFAYLHLVGWLVVEWL